MKSMKCLILLLTILVLYIASGHFMMIVRFSPTEIPDAFSSFNPMLWLTILSLGPLLTVFSLRNWPTEVVASILLWSIFYVIPAVVNYPVLGLNIEQLVFAKWKIENQGWPAAYTLWTVMSMISNLDAIAVTLVLGWTITLLSVLLLLILSRKVMRKLGYAYTTILLFILPQTYFYKFFADYSYAFPILLILLYNSVLSIENSLKRECPPHATYLVFTLVSVSLILANPITSLVAFLFITIYTFIQWIFKFRAVRRLINWTILYIVLWASWYTHYHIASSAVSPWIKAIVQINRLEVALNPSSYVRFTTISFPLSLLYYYRYAMLILLGCFSLYSAYLHVRTKDKEKLAFHFSLLVACALPWFILTASTWENFSSRFMLFGMIPVALMSSHALFATSIKFRKILIIFLIVTLPVSFALSFSPSLFNASSHEWDFNAAYFIAEHLKDNYPVISDTWRVNYVRLYDPNMTVSPALDSVTVFNVDPENVHLPQSSHALLLSLPQRIQALASFGRPLDDWKRLDKKLETNYDLLYNNHYSLLWVKR
ncbi:MAG: hypothetical protein QW096_09580 [Thermofilaceae archaeon]